MRTVEETREAIHILVAMLDKRCVFNAAEAITALHEARAHLARLTPRWRAVPTVAEVRARDRKKWLRKTGIGVDVVVLTVMPWGDVEWVCVIYPPNPRAYVSDPFAQYWPCDDDGIREEQWPTVQPAGTP